MGSDTRMESLQRKVGGYNELVVGVDMEVHS